MYNRSSWVAVFLLWCPALSLAQLPTTIDLNVPFGTESSAVTRILGDDAVPEGLTDSDWNSIRQEYERHRHAAVAVDGEFRARNPGQQWLTHFDGRGFTVEPAIAGVEPDAVGWRWGLELQSYGFPGHERAVSGQARMTAQDDRVTYEWHAGLREWFVNDRRGLEHGFTLSVRPPGGGDPQPGAGQWLELRLAVRGGLRAQAHADGRGVSFVNEQGHTVVNYAGLKVWDADNRELPARIDADAAGLRLVVDERGARYPLTIDPIAQQAYLKASNTDAGDWFGWSVGVSGDTVVVGANREESNAVGVNGNEADNSAAFSGAAYVFVKGVGGAWSQQAYLKAPNTVAGGGFGFSVGVSGDTVVVGAFGALAGAAYVFVRDGAGIWTQQAFLKASSPDLNDWFGWSVCVSGDTVVVGAIQEDSNATGVNGNGADNGNLNTGAAYVFVKGAGGVWSQQAYLKASNTGFNDQFGHSVAVSGDTVVVGTRFEDSDATGVNGNQADADAFDFDSGAAYVFARDGGGFWTQQAYLKASNTDRDDWFGISVGVSGGTVVVGADHEDSNGNEADNSASGSGAAYVFVKGGGGIWTQQAYLKASNTDTGDLFAHSVGVSGDTVVVGASQERSSATGVNGNQADDSAGNSGAAYVFVRDGGGVWTQQAYLKASNTRSGDFFGRAVGVSGDTVVVGAIAEDSSATGVNGNQADDSAFDFDSGAAYVFVVVTQALLADPGGSDMNRFLSFVVPSGAVAGSGAETAIQIELSTLNNRCSADSDNLFEPCITDDDCTNGVCEAPFAASEGQLRYVNVVKTCQGGAMSTGEVICRSLSDCVIDEQCLQMRMCDGTTDLCASDTDCPKGVPCVASMSCPDDVFQSPFLCATTGCDPEYRDWASDLAGGVLHVYGPGIVPARSEYNLRQLPAGCSGNEASCASASDALMISTARWADMTGDGLTDARDIAAASDKVKPIPEAFTKPRTMLIPGILDPFRNVNVLELQNTVDAVKSLPMPGFIAGPEDCNG